MDGETEGSDYSLCDSNRETDLIFLNGILKYPFLANQRKTNSPELVKPLFLGSRDMRREIAYRYSLSQHFHARELSRLLNSAHIKALIDAHDTIGEKILHGSDFQNQLIHDVSPLSSTATTPSKSKKISKSVSNGFLKETLKIVRLRRNSSEPLGITVNVNDRKQLVVSRILSGGIIELQGLMHEGDVIREINGKVVSSPEDLIREITAAKDSIAFKIEPSIDDDYINKHDGVNASAQCFMRALFDYDPKEDRLHPCADIGLKFKKGDILQIVNISDPNWWQANNYLNPDHIGLIPSPELEERRRAFVPAAPTDIFHNIVFCGKRLAKKKVKTMYKSTENTKFDKADLIPYQEILKMPPFKRRTLVLVGVKGVGCNEITKRLIASDREKFETVQLYGTDPNALHYSHVDHDTLTEEIKNNKFIVYGSENGQQWGVYLKSIRAIISRGKMCVLDTTFMALKVLNSHTELIPFVVFIGAPELNKFKEIKAHVENGNLESVCTDNDLNNVILESQNLKQRYEKYFDLITINEHFDKTFDRIITALEKLSQEYQWVPIDWIY